jgi:quinolinate synthase
MDNIIDKILQIKKQKNAIILAHYYQDPEIQDIADYVGDSLDLSRKAHQNDYDEIYFCGVKFMAEVAKILSPNKRVFIPDSKAGCSLEESCPPALFKKFKEKHPNAIIASYINCSAEIKSLSDIIVTSSNAKKIISQLPLDQEIIFAPDQHLGRYIAKETERDMILWQGSCIVHEHFNEKELVKLKTNHPGAKIIAHPECPQTLLNYADFIGSTSALLNYVKNSASNDFIVLTEHHIIHQMKKLKKNANFYDCPTINEAGCTLCNNCPYMELNNLEKLYDVMINGDNSEYGLELILEKNLLNKAKRPLIKMLEMS